MLKIPIPPALQHRRYRLLWLGLLISIAGTRMQLAAVLWHISEISPLPIALGAVGLMDILPVLVFSLLAGVFADSINRRRLILVTQTSMALFAALLGWATLSNRDSLWLIYAVMAASASVSTFDLPARQALIPNLVPASVLTNAFSMNSIAFQLGSIAGPALAGLVLAHLGIGYAYVFNAVSYLAVIVALILMGPVEQELMAPAPIPGAHSRLAGWRTSVTEGLSFVAHQPVIFSSMLLDFFATFFSSATVLLPIFSKDILHVDVVGYGWLIAAPSVGAVLVAGATTGNVIIETISGEKTSQVVVAVQDPDLPTSGGAPPQGSESGLPTWQIAFLAIGAAALVSGFTIMIRRSRRT